MKVRTWGVLGAGCFFLVLFGFRALVHAGVEDTGFRVTAFGGPGALSTAEGRSHAGEERVAFEITEEGVVSAPEPARLFLPDTEGYAFFLEGEVKLGGTYEEMRFPEDLASGFTVFVREADSRHRYELNPVRIRNKRRLHEGQETAGIRTLERFPAPAAEQWHDFFVLATGDRIVFQFAGRFGRIDGPLDIGGENSIGVAPGTELRNLSVALLDGANATTGTEFNGGSASVDQPATIDIMIRIRASR